MAPRDTHARAVVAARLRAQGLVEPAATNGEAVVRRLLAVQAQDGRGARLAIRSRSTGLRAADVDHALSVTRSLVVTWLNRGTLHLVTSDDYWWLHPLTTPQLAATSRRRLSQEGVSPAEAERGIDVVVDAVTRDGPQTRDQLRERLDAAGVPTARQALVHVLLAATLRGHVVRGPVVDGDQAFVSTTDWLGPPPPPLDPDEALGRLARRYLEGHAPATVADLAKWAGITLSVARRAFAVIADDVETFGPPDAGLVWLGAETGRTTDPLPTRLLGPYDPLLHGWTSREMFVGRYGHVVTSNGVFRPVALDRGRVVATWRLAGGEVTIDPLEPIPARTRAALMDDAADVLRFLDLPRRSRRTKTSAGNAG
ncbi:MAG TPA: winged helix DNA-binding domain-containing protein [Acidimicrobiales bacterium]